MPLAPQEFRTYFITTVTANRRRLFQVEQNANLLIEVLQDQRTKNRLQLTPSSSCPTTRICS
jgi:putative transposase